MINSLEWLIDRLMKNPTVIGIIEYGSRSKSDSGCNGDYDIFVIIKEKLYPVESIHFYVDDIPIDINIRTIEDMRRDEPLSFVDKSICYGRIIYDENDVVKRIKNEIGNKWNKKEYELTEHDIAFQRFSHKHIIDKVRGRKDNDPVLCHLLLNTNIYWLIETYYLINRKEYPGEKKAIHYLKTDEPEIYDTIKTFYQSNEILKKIEITEKLSAFIFKNAGGLWRKDEIIALGINRQTDNLEEKGKKMFELLLGEA